MPRTVEIGEIDDDVYDALVRRAAELGLSVQEMFRNQIVRITARPTMDEWIEQTRRRRGARTERDTLEALDEVRGAWPS